VPDLGDDDLKALHERLKKLGPDRVRYLLVSDSFPTGMKMEIVNWLADQEAASREPHGSDLEKLFPSPDKSTSPVAEPRPATAPMIRTEITDVYDGNLEAGTKAPNINELAAVVQPRLSAKGHYASHNQIKKIGGEPEFKKRRGKPGVRWSKQAKT
jgi:hypothetical protein